jgi:hypothetical protein
MKRLVLLTIFLLCASSLAAQSFSVFDIDASAFPTMKAKFYAFDANGNRQNPSPSDIIVTENGTPRIVRSVSCPPTQPAKALSSVLVMDISGSMQGPNIGLAEAAATTWVNRLNLGQSECALTTFDQGNFFNQDYTKNKSKLLSAIASLVPQGGTDYDMGLYNSPAGGLEVTKNGKYQRIIIFLTDGLGQTQNTDAVIAEAKSQNCQIYAVTVGLPCPQCLKDISTQTRGMWFENVVTEDQINNAYLQILQQAQSGLPPCEISWESGPICVATERTAELIWEGQSQRLLYPSPITAVSQLQCNPIDVAIHPKKVNVRFDTTVTITAQNSPFNVTDISSTNPAFDINPKVFTVAAGESKSLTVSYTAFDSSFVWTSFLIQSDQCPSIIYASGSFTGYKTAVSILKLTKPNGGEEFVAGSDTEITWTGVPPPEQVTLSLSTDNGSNWTLITDKASNGRFPWHVPKTTSKTCLVKVEQNSLLRPSGWANRGGGKSYDEGRGIVVDAIGNVYATGIFESSADFGGQILTAIGFSGTYLVKYRPDGSIAWLKQIDGPDSDAGNGLAIDSAGNILVTGWFSGTTNFGGITLTTPGGSGMFIAKYHPDGSIEWVKQAGALGSSIASRSVATDALGNVYVTGDYTGPVDFETVTLPGTKNGYYSVFIAKYKTDGTFVWAKNSSFTGNFCYNIAVDAIGNSYITGNFSGAVKFGTTTLTSAGREDIFIAKYLTDGSVAWAKRFGSNEQDFGYGITLDGSGNIYADGFFEANATFDGFSLQSKGSSDLYLIKMHPDGLIEWVKQAGAIVPATTTFTYGFNVLAGPSGNIYVTGIFESTTDFGGITETSAGSEDIMVAKYHPDGEVEWVKRAGGVGGDRGLSIAVDRTENVYVTGIFGAQADFDEVKLQEAGQNNGDMFVWKVGNEKKESDVSDAVFSIVMPQAASQNIDMGKVLVAKAKDSVVQTFVSNTGTYPFRVDTIIIVGADASNFSLLSGVPPFTVGAGTAQRVEFRFKPISSGLKTAQILIITQADTLTQTITGEGVLPTISVAGNLIDFGQIPVGSFKDTTITVAIQNNGTVPVDFSSASQLGPDKTQFSVQSGGSAFTLAPGASQTVTLRFAPKFIGRTSGRIGFDYNGPGSPAVLNLFGQGLGGLVRMLDDSAYSGQHRDVPLILEKVPVSSVQSVATNFKARVLYDKTVLYPTDNTIEQGVRYDTVTLTGSLGIDEVIARIPFIAMLGMSQISPMSIVDFQWLDASGNPADFEVETESGTFKVLDICDQGGKRLYDPDGKVSMSSIIPNPASNTVRIQTQTIEKGRTELTVTNLLGQTVATIFDGEIEPGIHDFQLSTSSLSAGSYFLTLRTPTVRKIQRFDIAK